MRGHAVLIGVVLGILSTSFINSVENWGYPVLVLFCIALAIACDGFVIGGRWARDVMTKKARPMPHHDGG